jgi:hypothetical protein
VTRSSVRWNSKWKCLQLEGLKHLYGALKGRVVLVVVIFVFFCLFAQGNQICCKAITGKEKVAFELRLTCPLEVLGILEFAYYQCSSMFPD